MEAVSALLSSTVRGMVAVSEMSSWMALSQSIDSEVISGTSGAVRFANADNTQNRETTNGHFRL